VEVLTADAQVERAVARCAHAGGTSLGPLRRRRRRPGAVRDRRWRPSCWCRTAATPRRPAAHGRPRAQMAPVYTVGVGPRRSLRPRSAQRHRRSLGARRQPRRPHGHARRPRQPRHRAGADAAQRARDRGARRDPAGRRRAGPGDVHRGARSRRARRVPRRDRRGRARVDRGQQSRRGARAAARPAPARARPRGRAGLRSHFLKRALQLDPSLEIDSVVRKGRNDVGQDTFYVQAVGSRTARSRRGFPRPARRCSPTTRSCWRTRRSTRCHASSSSRSPTSSPCAAAACSCSARARSDPAASPARRSMPRCRSI
jgi:hypothetical protein